MAAILAIVFAIHIVALDFEVVFIVDTPT